MSIKTNPVIDEAVKNFTMVLFKILFKRDTPFLEKYQMVVIHVQENKVWACYFLAAVFVLALVSIPLFEWLVSKF